MTKQKTPKVDVTALLTVEELCDLLHCHPVTLANQRREGTGFPFIKFGRRVFYRRADVEAVLAQNYRGTPAAA